MDGATIIKKNAVAIFNFHLDNITGNPQIFFQNFRIRLAEKSNQPFNIVFIQRHGCLALAASTAKPTLKYLLFHFFTPFAGHTLKPGSLSATQAIYNL